MTIIALDLEGTLISSAVSVFTRAGLRAFIERCRALADEVVLFSSVTPARVREILALLEGDGELPAGFAAATRIIHPGEYSRKNLRLVGVIEDVLLVDDADVAWYGQEHRLVPVTPFEPPYSPDDVLVRCADALERRIHAERRQDVPAHPKA